MSTSTIHILTALLPLLITGIALFFMASGTLWQRNKLINYGLILLIINAIVTTFTSAMGGASVKLVKSLPGVKEISVSIHAWTAMTAFLLSLLIAGLSMAAIRNRNFSKKRINTVFITVLLFLVFLIITSILATHIR